jgi:hypothetical protein
MDYSYWIWIYNIIEDGGQYLPIDWAIEWKSEGTAEVESEGVHRRESQFTDECY